MKRMKTLWNLNLGLENPRSSSSGNISPISGSKKKSRRKWNRFMSGKSSLEAIMENESSNTTDDEYCQNEKKTDFIERARNDPHKEKIIRELEKYSFTDEELEEFILDFIDPLDVMKAELQKRDVDKKI